MNQYLGLIQQGLFFGFFLTLFLSVVSYFVTPQLYSKIRSMNPSQQSSILFIWSVLPLLGSLFILFIALLPSLLEVLGVGTDHCLGHPEGHLHFCLIHLNTPINSIFIWGPALTYLGGLLTIIIYLCVDLCEILRFKRKINNFKPEKIDTDIFLLHTDTPLALSCGLWKQQIFLSTGLMNKLTKEENDIVIKHERAHIARKDSIRKFIARALSLAHFPSARHKILSNFILANEQACDDASVKNLQDKSKAAELLIKIEKLYRGHFFVQSALASGVFSLETNLLTERIHNLLNRNNSPVSTLQLILLAMMVVGIPILSHDVIHDSLEHLMYLLTLFVL